MNIERAEYVVGRVTRLRDSAKANLAKFQEDLQKNPVNALSWADQAFRAAADQQLCDQVLSTLNHMLMETELDLEQAIAKLHASILLDVITAARSIPGSSSPSSNAMTNHLNVARATMLEMLGDR